LEFAFEENLSRPNAWATLTAIWILKSIAGPLFILFAYYIEKPMKITRILLWVQSSYMLLTAIWPLVDIHSFMKVTGPKTDIWLVKTVGALLIPVGLCLMYHLFIRTDQRPAILLGGLTAVSFICVDFYYALNDVISDIYMADGVLQIIFLSAWILVASKKNP
jgi:hypothetical protein